MSYCATCEGDFRLKEDLPEDVLDFAEDIFDSVEVVGKNLYLYNYGNYHDYDVEELLNKITKYIECGDLYFSGEDNCFWKFSVKDNEWHEYGGEVVYEDQPKLSLSESDRSEFLGQIIDQVQDALEKQGWNISITGMPYAELKTAIQDTLKNWNVL